MMERFFVHIEKESERLLERAILDNDNMPVIKDCLQEYLQLILFSLASTSEHKLKNQTLQAAKRHAELGAKSTSFYVSFGHARATLSHQLHELSIELPGVDRNANEYLAAEHRLLRAYERYEHVYTSENGKLIERLAEGKIIPILRVQADTGVWPLLWESKEDEKNLVYMLEEAKSLRLRRLIIDLSAIEHIDRASLQPFIKILNALQMLGIDIILSGLQPKVASTLVVLDLDTEFEKFHIVTHLNQAL